MSQSKSKPEIRKTVVMPAGERVGVEIHVADADSPTENPNTQITLSMMVETYDSPIFAHLQLAAINAAIEILEGLRKEIHGR